VAALSLNILFDGQSIHITTSASLKAFSLDKTLERLWDENLEAYFKQQQISYEKH
jgi:general stress protein 26